MSNVKGRDVPIALAEVAHELRAPLGGIDAMAELLAATDLSAEQRRLVEGLQAAARHLRAVAGEIIDAARGGGAHPGLAAEPFDLQGLIQSAAVAAEARARAKGLAFRVEMDERLPCALSGDPRRIRQMLENLLDNAFKVTSEGHVRLSVRQADKRGVYVGLLFEVADTGPGFGPEARERLFRTFSRLDDGLPGSGLGLALVARMARAMGGDAGCASEPGQGASFWFTLRLRLAEAAGDDAADRAPPEAHQRLPILVVDDNHANRVILRAILDHFGQETIEAASGEEALDILGRTPVAAVMLDHTLPGVSGLETLRRLRAGSGPQSRVPVVPVTGRVAPEDKAAFAAAGACGFVEKPITARAIRDALEAALGARRRGGAAA